MELEKKIHQQKGNLQIQRKKIQNQISLCKMNGKLKVISIAMVTTNFLS